MDFREATDALLKPVPIKVVADILDVPIQSVRQARIKKSGSQGYRTPPRDWEQAIAKLALAQSKRLAEIAALLQKKAKDQ